MTDDSTYNDAERRRYFRIDDRIGISIRFATPPQKPNLRIAGTELSAAQLLESISAEFNSLVNAIWSESPTVAKALGLLNRKIDLLGVELENEIFPHPMDDVIESFDDLAVNISACGIAFQHDRQLEAGERLELELTLKPSNMRITAFATVVDQAALPEGSDAAYWSQMEFELNMTDEENLIQHIVQRQVQTLGKSVNEEG